MSDALELVKDKSRRRPKVTRDTSLMKQGEPSVAAPDQPSTEATVKMGPRRNVRLVEHLDKKAKQLVSEHNVTLETLFEAFLEQLDEQDIDEVIAIAKRRREIRVKAGNRRRLQTLMQNQEVE